jgi:high-affinity iron transporter
MQSPKVERAPGVRPAGCRTQQERNRIGRLQGASGRVLCVSLFVLIATLSCGARALALGGQSPRPIRNATIGRADAAGLHALLVVVPAQYAGADPTHDTTLAAITRSLAQGARTRVLELAPELDARDRAHTTQALHSLDRLVRMLRPTAVRFQPWPLASEVSALSTRAQQALDAMLRAPAAPARPYGQIESALDEVGEAPVGDHGSRTGFALLRAYALYAAGPGQRLQTADPPLAAEIARDALLGGSRRPSLAYLLAHGAPAAQIESASAHLRADMNLVAQTLDEVTISRATIVTNAAIIVFREGLEAVLILAAITASFVGARSHLRRPIMIGALAGLGATALTWVIAQMILHLLGDGGLELQAVTGLLAIGVLLLVTNWFFHRVYWSEWISRFNRRRRAMERWEGIGFVSGQALGFVLLGLSSVYREGLETVLFLQALQSSAGTRATALGAGIGLGATLLVGLATFKLQRKLPYRRMLIVTGVLIALVLAVMVGTTVHNMQGIGWLPITATSFTVPVRWSTWLGVFPTWEGIGAQLFSLVFVLGSYFAAREIQVKSRLRRARRTDQAIAPMPATPIGT